MGNSSERTAAYRLRQKQALGDRACSCGVSFAITDRADKLYCSARCRMAAHRQGQGYRGYTAPMYECNYGTVGYLPDNRRAILLTELGYGGICQVMTDSGVEEFSPDTPFREAGREAGKLYDLFKPNMEALGYYVD